MCRVHVAHMHGAYSTHACGMALKSGTALAITTFHHNHICLAVPLEQALLYACLSV